MTVALTANFFKNARGFTFLDSAGVTWSFNQNTNALTATAAGGGGSGTVTSIAAGSANIVIGGTPTVAPTVDLSTTAKADLALAATALQAAVTSVGLTVNATYIALTGASPITSTGSWALDLSTAAKANLALAATSVQSVGSSNLTVGGTATAPTLSLSGTQVTNIGLGGTALQSVSLTDASTTPIYTTAGSSALSLTFKTQTASTFLRGPAAGASAAQPTFGAIALADLPTGAVPNITPDTHPASPTVFDDEFEFGSSIDLTGARAPSALAWAWTNQNTSTAVVSEGSLVFTAVAGGARNAAILMQSLSGVTAPWSFTCKFQADNLPSAAQCGMVVKGSGGYIVFGIAATNTTTARWNVQSLTNPTTLSANIVTTPTLANVWSFGGSCSTNAFYLQISLNAGGTVLTFSASMTGVPGSFVTIGTASLSTLIITTSNIGVYCDPEGTTGGRSVYDWFRKTA